jgi:hypothetical protein
MFRGRRASSRWLSVVIASLVIASLLVTGKSLVAPSAADARPAGCQSKQSIAFIGLPGVDNLGPMVSPLKKLRNLWPVQRLQFRYLTSAQDFDGPELDTIVNELESRVDNLESLGFNRIGLPSRSLLLQPFIHGTAGSLGGQTIEQRHPDTVFVTMNNGTSATEDPVAASKVFRFLDVPSNSAGTTLNFGSMFGVSGQMLIIYQASDLPAEDIRDDYLQLATDLGVIATTAPVDFDGSNFNAADLADAGNAVLNLPVGSVVVHIVNGALSDQYAADATANSTIFYDNSGQIRHFGGNFFPTNGIAVQLELGYQLVDRPSWQATRAGFPSRYRPFYDDPRQKLYMEAFGFLAKCGTFNGILDGWLRFDEGGTRINKELERIYLARFETTVSFGDRVDNERWYDDKVAWDWDQVFGE